MVTGRSACGICKSGYDEGPDVYRISAHLDESSIANRAARLAAGSISLDELTELPNEIRCPSLRAIVTATIELILNATTSRSQLGPVVTPVAADAMRQRLVSGAAQAEEEDCTGWG